MCKSWLVPATLLLMVLHVASGVTAAVKNDAPHGWVEFTSFRYRGEEAAAPRPGEFRNPILPGFYPDPSICRAGDAYFLVTSTFAYYPGIPIFKSKDLVNWTQVGHVLDRPSQLNTGGLYTSEGVFAPTINHHDGTFYVLNTLVGAGGNFYVMATDPAGPWSDPVWLKDVNGIDPDFFFDDDDKKVYLIHNGPPPDDRPLYQGHRAIWLYEFDLAAKNVKRETGRIIVNGGADPSKKPVWIEGPHIFRRNGTYYLTAAEGGTSIDHSQVVFRSKSVWGPWEPYAGNPILTQRHLDPKRDDAVTCVGHCDFVETPAGEWWTVLLGCRPYERGVGDMTNLGRETFLLPVTWQDDGWPSILRGDERVPMTVKLPKGAAPPRDAKRSFDWTDEFDRDRLAQEWMFLRTPPAEPWFSLSAKPGSLMIAPRDVELRSKANPSFIARRQQHATFSAVAAVDTGAVRGRADAGLAAFGNETYLFLGVRVADGGAREVFVERVAPSRRSYPGQAPPPPLPAEVVASKALPDGAARLELRVRGDGRWYRFDYRADAASGWTAVAEKVDAGHLSTHEAGGFVGTTLGMFARSAGN